MSVISDKIEMLLIDDDESVVRLLTPQIRSLFDERVVLTEMSDPVTARHWIETHAPELVLTDLQMPVVDGFEILRYARKCNPYCQVIFHSSHFSAEALCLALRLEAADYVPKSVGLEDLLQVLEYAYHRLIRWRQALPMKPACL